MVVSKDFGLMYEEQKAQIILKSTHVGKMVPFFVLTYSYQITRPILVNSETTKTRFKPLITPGSLVALVLV